MAAKRLAAEWAAMEANPDEKDRFFGESKINDLKWTMRLMIDDDADCCYAGGCYELELTFPIEYPFKMPIITFNPPLFHTCISQQDGQCVPWIERDGPGDVVTMGQAWGPLKNVRWIMCELHKMFLNEANPDELHKMIIAPDIMRLKQENYEAFVKKVKDQITELNDR